MTKTSLKFLLPALAIVVLMPLYVVKAFAVKTGETINVATSEVVDGNLYVAGSVLTIDGNVKGDVICAGQSVTISGRVEGDVLCAAQSINVLGEVMGNVRIAGNNLNINNKVGKNVMAFGAVTVLGTEANVGWDMLVAGAMVNVAGRIEGSLHGLSNLVNIDGQIGKDVALNLDNGKRKKQFKSKANLIIGETASIGGNLEYESAVEAKIFANEAIGGKISRQLPLASERTMSENFILGMAMLWLWCKIVGLLGAMVIGVVLIVCFKKKLLAVMDGMVTGTKTAMGVGVLVLLLTPIILVLLAVTIVGLPLAGILTCLFIAGMMIGKVLVAMFAGLVVMGRYRHKLPKGGRQMETTGNFILAMIIGLVIASALYVIPIFGWLLMLLAKIWGLGVLGLLVRKYLLTK